MKKFERLIHHGKIIGGKLTLENQRWFRGMVQLYDDCPVVITLERKKNSRSKEQMGYMWGVVYPIISQSTGHTTEDLHDIFKAKYLKRKKMWRGTEMTTVGSTEGLTTGEMAEFLTNVILDAEELGISIPPPDPSYQWKE